MKKVLRACDMFSVSQFTLYQSKEQYGTATGGVGSLIIFGILLGLLFQMSLDTLNYANITVNSQNVYEIKPSNYKLTANPSEKFMFAVGVISDNYFDTNSIDIKVYNYTIENTKNYQDYNNNQIEMEYCNISHWEGISDQVTLAFSELKLDRFICPVINQTIQIEGKNLQNIFKYTSIQISKCPENNPKFCDYGGFKYSGPLNMTPTVNIFYVNSIVNPSNNNAVDYYIEDINSFEFDFNTSFTANIEFSQYQITTDRSLLPWASNEVQSGINTVGMANSQSHSLNLDTYSRINFRKSSQRTKVTRSYKKLSDVLSFVGGLLGPLLLSFSFLKIYNKFAFEIEFGDRIFKYTKNTSIGSEDFNIFVFLQYLIYSMFRCLGVGKTWMNIQKYSQCMSEAVKQLDIHLLYRKIQLFEEVCNTVLEKHHMIGLHLLSKKTLQHSKKIRKRHLMQEIIYGELQKLGQVVSVEEEEYVKQRQRFLESFAQQLQKDDATKRQQLDMHREFVDNYKLLQLQCDKGDRYSYKIMMKLQQRKQTPADLGRSDEWPVVFDASQSPVAEQLYPQTQNAIIAQRM